MKKKLIAQKSREKAVKAGIPEATKPKIIEPTESHLMIALRLIKLRWDDLDFSDKAEERGSHGVFFTAPQLHALADIAAERMKEQASKAKRK